jgi:tRNA(Met) C34 N-acetyltransferase TmcA
MVLKRYRFICPFKLKNQKYIGGGKNMNLEFGDGFTIRRAANEESNKIINLLKQTAQWIKENKINQWRFLLEGNQDEEIKQDILNEKTYIVLKGNELVATFTLLSQQSEWDRHLWGDDSSSKSVYLHRLAVSTPYMKRGMGKSILDWVQNNVSGSEYLKLDCVAENRKLNTFYKNNGFELVGLTDGHNKYQKLIKNSII